MKAYELMNEIYNAVPRSENTCDTLKCGSADKEIKKAAVCCIASVEVIRDAAEWGADMIITHEPTVFDHMDIIDIEDEITRKKLQLIEEAGMTVYRFHDGMHAAEFDMIAEGELHYIGLDGVYEKGDSFACNRFTLKEPMSALELAEHISKALNISHIRICGERHKKSTKIALCFGSPGEGIFKALKDGESEIAIAGEVCEWQWGEYARDAAAFGYNKTLMILGHMGSEKDGMRLLSKRLAEKYPQVEFKYFDCGEVY